MSEATTTTAEATESERQKSLKAAYTAATSRLREERRDEFDKFYAEEAQKRGVDYTPRLTPEQKAEQQLETLLRDYPHLVDRIQPQVPRKE